MNDFPGIWMEHSLGREDDRGDRFEGIGKLVKRTNPSVPKWRHVILKWYSEVTRAFKLSPITSEISLFFFDSLIAASVGRTIEVSDLQLNGLVALLVASKMFGTSPQFKVAELLRLAPHLRINQKEICIMELKLLQTLQFNLFITTTIEFSLALIGRVVSQIDQPEFNENTLRNFAVKYIRYLDFEFSTIEYRQSEKARAVVHCAIARWTLSHMVLTSKERECEMMTSCLEAIEKEPLGENVDFFLDHTALEVLDIWRQLLSSLYRLTSHSQSRNSHLEALIVSAIGADESSIYPTISVPRRIAPPLAPLEVTESSNLQVARNSIAFSSLACDDMGHNSMSPVDVMDLEAHMEDSLVNSLEKKSVCRRSGSPSHRQLDLVEEEAVKRQKV